VRADFDSLLGQTFQPITTEYTMTAVTNSHTVVQRFQRVVTAPDILFSAEDQASPKVGQIGANIGSRNLNFSQANVLPGLAGPGVINPSTTITYDKVGDIFLNGSLALFALTTNSFLNELTQTPLIAWASFDDSTNDRWFIQMAQASRICKIRFSSRFRRRVCRTPLRARFIPRHFLRQAARSASRSHGRQADCHLD